MSGNLGHIRPRLSYGRHISSKTIHVIIHLWMATVSDHTCSTWPSLYNNHNADHASLNLYIYIISVLPSGRSLTENSGTKAAILPKDRSSIANSGTLAPVLLGMNRCGSFPLLSLFSIWTNLKRSEKIPGAPTRRWGEWMWLTGPSGLHRNSQFHQGFWPDQRSENPNHPSPPYIYI